MEYCGIILAKSESRRLPNKNFLYLQGMPVYQYAVTALKGIDTYVFSDKLGNRPPGASLTDEPLFSALQWAYKSLPKRYEAIISIQANCPIITESDVDRAMYRFEALNCQELRGFNEKGEESGLIILKEDYLIKKHEISTYIGSVIIESKEIHDINDFNECQYILSQR
jgi:spore coat polysaccharide biosynthesis protein SpsF (cytidylyltransferase family)